MDGKPPLKFFSGRATRYLAEKIVNSFGNELGQSSVLEFSDGEFLPSFDESVRGCKVFIIQSTFPPVDNLFELLMLIDAAKRASAYNIVAVLPYFGFARQDRKDKPRVSIGAKLVADLLTTAGVDRVMTMDLHADQIQGFFNVPVDHIFASSLFVPYIKDLNLDNLVIAAPDMGGTKRDVKDKNIVIVDDMVDTAGTLTLAAQMMVDKGAKSVRAATTHPVLSGNAYERIENSPIKELLVTDSIPLRQESKKIKVISVANVFADVINKVYNYQSISNSFIQ